MLTQPVDVEIVSFGFLHAPAPAAHIVLDLRHHFRDPHINPALRELTADDEPVRAAVAATPGIDVLLNATLTGVLGFLTGPSTGLVTVADGCAGGRHRAPAFAMTLADRLRFIGLTVQVTHRDMHRPVVQR
ncbi:ATPase [Streptomyces sp. NPDC008317]|uniref:RapZ C-terminal domain-containing protein n=1 Tax=Streptomyces sp. NPDC008317 TaxID=3364827 RepID=UPI0036ECC3E2